jgi:bifunctional UDP-N-acetylglucosamine pyrophosphorylase/glucosamine-1-phosphate N-acetyltransferase
MTSTRRVSVLIAAAGLGTRSGLAYPKTLYPVSGKPILIHLLELFNSIDKKPTIIVSPKGFQSIQDCLEEYNFSAHLVLQEQPKGMGDAVLRFTDSPAYSESKEIVLAWGDIPFIQQETLETLISEHFHQVNDFTFPTQIVEEAYTLVKRDKHSQIIDVIETKENGLTPRRGEREMGLFVFNKSKIFSALKLDSKKKYSKLSGEHGFLYIISDLVAQGHKVEALPIAKKLDLISLNNISDLGEFK